MASVGLDECGALVVEELFENEFWFDVELSWEEEFGEWKRVFK